MPGFIPWIMTEPVAYTGKQIHQKQVIEDPLLATYQHHREHGGYGLILNDFISISASDVIHPIIVGCIMQEGYFGLDIRSFQDMGVPLTAVVPVGRGYKLISELGNGSKRIHIINISAGTDNSQTELHGLSRLHAVFVRKKGGSHQGRQKA